MDNYLCTLNSCAVIKAMEIISEIEDEFSSLESMSLAITRIRTSAAIHSLTETIIGEDVIVGRRGSVVVLIPLPAALELTGQEPTRNKVVSLCQLLEAQKQPVLIHYRLPDSVVSSWLLTIASPWLRLAHPQGVIWIPISRLEYAEIECASRELIGA